MIENFKSVTLTFGQLQQLHDVIYPYQLSDFLGFLNKHRQKTQQKDNIQKQCHNL